MNAPSAAVALKSFVDAAPDTLLAGLRSVDCSDFWNVFATARDAASQAGEPKRAAALDVLAGASSLVLRPGEPLRPFAPLLEMTFGSSARPDAYRGPQAEILAELAPTIAQPALRARLADLAWFLAKRPSSARLAIQAYLDCVQRVLRHRAIMRGDRGEASSTRALDLLRRACVIQRQLGWAEDQTPDLIVAAKKTRDQARRRGDALGYVRAAELTLDFDLANPLFIGRTAEKIAAKGVNGVDEHAEIALRELAVTAFRRARRKTDADRALAALAEAQVRVADRMARIPFQEVHWLEKAIATLRQFKGTNERRADLQGRLVRAQGRIGEFMVPMSTKFDGQNLADGTRIHLHGLDLNDALLAYSTLSMSPVVTELRAQAAESFASTPLAGLFAPLIYDPKFKVASRLPAVDFAGQPDEANLRFKIIQLEEMRRAITVAGQIDPGRVQIVIDHQPDERVLTRLAALSPLVPAGHEMFFGRGFAHFFNADFIEAAHLLVLQLEPLLRHVLVSADIDVTRFKTDRTQSNATLTVLLDPDGDYRKPLEELLGEEIVFEIENLFDLQEGPALRHRLAHGLFNQWFFARNDIVYACWFLYRLCVAPMTDYPDEVRNRLST